MWFRGLGPEPETWRVADSIARWVTDGFRNPFRRLQVSELLALCSAAVAPCTGQKYKEKVKRKAKTWKI